MLIVAAFALAFASADPTADASPAATPPATTPPATTPPATTPPATTPPATTPPATTAATAGEATPEDRALVAAFAVGAHDRRLTAAGAYALTSAAMIGGGITYVAVSYLDGSLGTVPGEDTVFSGAVLGATALVPAALAGMELFVRAPAEKRLDEIDEGATHEEILNAQAEAAANTGWVRIGTTAAFFAGGAVAATAGGLSLARPHTLEHRSFVTHGTGAELIGLGVASVGAGVFTLIAGNDDEKLLQALQQQQQ